MTCERCKQIPDDLMIKMLSERVAYLEKRSELLVQKLEARDIESGFKKWVKV